MGWQLPLVALCLIGAVAYLARRTWRTWSGQGGGCGNCRCAAPKKPASGLIPSSELTLRLRERM